MFTPLRIIGLSLIIAGSTAAYTVPAFASHDDYDSGRYYYDTYGRRYYEEYNTGRRYYDNENRSSGYSNRTRTQDSRGDRLENFVCYYYNAAGQCTNYSYTNSRTGRSSSTNYNSDDYYYNTYRGTYDTDACRRYGSSDYRCRGSRINASTSDYNRGYREGYGEGYDNGRSANRSSTRSTSEYNRGYRDGYDDGYDEGRLLRSEYYYNSNYNYGY